MKKQNSVWMLISAALAVVLLLSQADFAQSQEKPSQEKPSQEKSKQEALSSLTMKAVKGGCDNTGFCCARDEAKFSKALESVSGVSKVVTNKKTEEVTIDYKKGQLKLQDLVKALDKAGFAVAL